MKASATIRKCQKYCTRIQHRAGKGEEKWKGVCVTGLISGLYICGTVHQILTGHILWDI